jgi:hypothetical protein
MAFISVTMFSLRVIAMRLSLENPCLESQAVTMRDMTLVRLSPSE